MSLYLEDKSITQMLSKDKLGFNKTSLGGYTPWPLPRCGAMGR